MHNLIYKNLPFNEAVLLSKLSFVILLRENAKGKKNQLKHLISVKYGNYGKLYKKQIVISQLHNK